MLGFSTPKKHKGKSTDYGINLVLGKDFKLPLVNYLLTNFYFIIFQIEQCLRPGQGMKFWTTGLQLHKILILILQLSYSDNIF
jgi:hypothetical protein